MTDEVFQQFSRLADSDEDAWRLRMLNSALAGKTLCEIDYEFCQNNNDMFYAFPISRLSEMIPLLNFWFDSNRNILDIVETILTSASNSYRAIDARDNSL